MLSNLWCWRRLLRVPWTASGSNQSILKEINPEYSLERLFLKLKLQYFNHLMWRLWCWERLKVGREGDDRGWDGWMASPTQWTWVWVGDGQGGLACYSPWCCKESDMTQRLNWTELSERQGSLACRVSMGSRSQIRLSDWTQQGAHIPADVAGPGSHSLLLQRLQLLELEPEASDCWGWWGTTSATAVEMYCLNRIPEPAHALPYLLMQGKKNTHTHTDTDFSLPFAFKSPNSAFHWQNLTGKHLARKSVRYSIKAPSHPVIQRRF